MEIHHIKRVHHFYYCILIAVKMHGREKRYLNKIDQNTFIACWLNKASKNHIFECTLYDEIKWLRTQMRGHGMRRDIVAMVENIVVKLDFLLNIQEERAIHSN